MFGKGLRRFMIDWSDYNLLAKDEEKALKKIHKAKAVILKHNFEEFDAKT